MEQESWRCRRSGSVGHGPIWMMSMSRAGGRRWLERGRGVVAPVRKNVAFTGAAPAVWAAECG